MILTVFGFPWLIQAVAREVKEPPVIRATDTTRFDVGVFERTPPVGTMQAHETYAPFQVAEKNEFFAQDLNANGNIAELLGCSHNKPVSAEPFTYMSFTANMG
jgi:hypothetical protein